MSGEQIIESLDHPMGNESVADCIYAASGLRLTVAPWRKQGERILKVTLADGSELEPDKLYTVAAWEGTINDEYITEVVERLPETWEELMKAKLIADKTISPSIKSRIKLIWK